MSRLRRWFADLVSDHPHTVLSFKAALAAAAAWLLVKPFGGVADDYPYYAPLGAVVVMSTAVMTSLRTGLQAVTSIGLGAALGVAVLQLPMPGIASLVAVTGIGMAVASWGKLGAMGVWVPFAGLFVLVFAGNNPWHYVLGYAGMTAVGAAVGIVVNLALPQLPLGRTLHAVSGLRDELARHMRALADDLSDADDLGSSVGIKASVDPHANRLDQLVSEVRESRRINWRAGRWQHVADRREEQARALETMAYLVEEVGVLLARPGHMLTGPSQVGDAVADALRCTANMLEATDFAGASQERDIPYEEARRSVARLRQVTLQQRDSADAVLIGSSVTVSLQRAVEAWNY